MYLSVEGHDSFVKLARATGIGDCAICRVPVTAELTMDVDQLQALIREDRQSGQFRFCWSLLWGPQRLA